MLVEPAITNVKFFGVGGFVVDAVARAFGMSGICGGITGQALGPGERKPASGICFAEKNGCRGPAAFIARPPHLQNGFYFCEPRHSDRLADVEDDDGIRIGGGDFFHQLVLLAGKSEDRLAAGPDLISQAEQKTLGASAPRGESRAETMKGGVTGLE